MRLALDTNILAYAEGVNGSERQQQALAVLAQHDADTILLPAQVLGELFAVLTRKAKRDAADARAAVLGWIDAYDAVIPTTAEIVQDAMELVVGHRLGFWDAVIVAAAAEAGCRVLLSEDLQDGFVWRGLVVRNPFVAETS